MWLEKVNAAGGHQCRRQEDEGRSWSSTTTSPTDSEPASSPKSSSPTTRSISCSRRSDPDTPRSSPPSRNAIRHRSSPAPSSSESVFDQNLEASVRHAVAERRHDRPDGEILQGARCRTLKRVAVLGRDDVFPKAMAQGISAAPKTGGLDVVYDQLYAVGTMDHSAALSAIKAARPDWIYVTGYTQDLILARKQMSDLGIKAPIVTMVAGPAYKEYIDGLGNLGERRDQLELVAPGDELQGRRRVADDRGLLQGVRRQGKERPGLRPCLLRGGHRRAQRRDRAGRHARQEEGARCAREDRRHRRSTGRSSSAPTA